MAKHNKMDSFYTKTQPKEKGSLGDPSDRPNNPMTNEDMFGELLPNVYIDKISLDSAGEEIITTIDLSMRQILRGDFIGTWFDDEDFIKYINLMVLQSTSASETAQLSASERWESQIDFDTYCTANDIKKTIISIDGVFNNTKETTDQLIKRHSKMDSDGNTVVEINFQTQFKSTGNTKHLSYFAAAYIDLGEIMKANDIAIDTEEYHMGRITSEIVIDKWSLVNRTYIFYTPDEQVWSGAVHKMNDQWMTHEKHQEGVSVNLTRRSVANNKIQDFREIEKIERLFLGETEKSDGLALFDKGEFSPENKFKFLKNDNMAPKKKSVYFSDIHLSRDLNGMAKFSFALDFQKVIIESSTLSGLYSSISNQGSTPDLLSLVGKSKIQSMKLKRRRIIEVSTSNRLGNVSSGEVLFNQNEPEETLAITQDNKAKSINSIRPDGENIAYLEEISLAAAEKSGIRFFNCKDPSMRNITNGIYQYGVDVVVEDGSIEYLSELIDDLSRYRKKLNEYYIKGTELGMAKYISEIQDPHIDSTSERVSEISKSSGNYNPTSNRFTEKFQEEWGDKEEFWLTPATNLGKIIKTISARGVDTAPLIYMVSPYRGNPRSVKAVIDMADRMIIKLSSLIGLDENSKKLTTRATTIEHWFDSDQFDTESSGENLGFDYLSRFEEYGSMGDGLKEVMGSNFNHRIFDENEKYFKYSDPHTLTQNMNVDFVDRKTFIDSGWSFLSPSFCHLNDKAFNFIEAQTSLHDYDLYKQLEVDILNYSTNRAASYSNNRPSDVDTRGVPIEIKSAETIFSNINFTIDPIDVDNYDLDDKNPNNTHAYDPTYLDDVTAKTLAGNTTKNKVFLSLVDVFSQSGALNYNSTQNVFGLYNDNSRTLFKNTSVNSNSIDVWSTLAKDDLTDGYNKSVANSLTSSSDSTAKVVKSHLPNQLKSLIVSNIDPSYVRRNIFTPPGPLNPPAPAAYFRLNYLLINRIEVFKGYGQTGEKLKNPIWEPLTEETYSQPEPNGKYFLCRMRPLEIPSLGVKRPRGLNIPVLDRYFLLWAKNSWTRNITKWSD